METFDKITNTAKTFSLEKSQKEAIMMAVSSHMTKNPISIVSPYQSAQSPYAGFWTFRNKLFVPAIAALVLMISGGTALAANFSLPGDTLYPIKVNINENIKSFFAFGSAAKAKDEAQIANKRIEEAEALAAKGKIDERTKDALTKSFNKHANKVKSLTAELKAKGDVTAATSIDSNFKSSLSAHQEVLRKIKGADVKNDTNIKDIDSTMSTYINEENKTSVESVETTPIPTHL